jgi:hypothetical protein
MSKIQNPKKVLEKRMKNRLVTRMLSKTFLGLKSCDDTFFHFFTKNPEHNFLLLKYDS